MAVKKAFLTAVTLQYIFITTKRQCIVEALRETIEWALSCQRCDERHSRCQRTPLCLILASLGQILAEIDRTSRQMQSRNHFHRQKRPIKTCGTRASEDHCICTVREAVRYQDVEGNQGSSYYNYGDDSHIFHLLRRGLGLYSASQSPQQWRIESCLTK